MYKCSQPATQPAMAAHERPSGDESDFSISHDDSEGITETMHAVRDINTVLGKEKIKIDALKETKRFAKIS